MERPNSHSRTLSELRARAEAALEAGDTGTAGRLAEKLLTGNTDQTAWSYGNNIHDGNQILGLAALRRGDTGAAKDYLLAAGRTPGSPQLDSFGPTMTLAQALLGLGERRAVLDYLSAVGRFWASPRPVQLTGAWPSKTGLLDGLRLTNWWVAFINRWVLLWWKSSIWAGGVPTLNRV